MALMTHQPHTLAEWHAAISSACEHVRTEGHGWRFAPCPACGGGSKDTGWLRRGRTGVVAGCNGGCTFEALAVALFAPNGKRPRPAPNWQDPPPTPPRQDPVAVAAWAWALVNGGNLGPRARAWLQKRGLDADMLDRHGWRSAETPPDRDTVARLAKARGVTLWDKWKDRAPRWLIAPMRDGKGNVVSVRFRHLDQGRWLTLKNDRGRLIGLSAAAESISPDRVLHVVEGETDWASLTQLGAVAVGLPGAGALHDDLVALVDRAGVRRVATWFDGDRAGARAREKLEDALPETVGVEHVTPPPGQDANDLLRAGRLEAMLAEAEADVAEPEPDPEPEPEPADEEDEDDGGYVRRRDLTNQQERFQVDPTALAHRILDRAAARIAIVVQPDESTDALMLRKCGRWTHSPEPWRSVLVREMQGMLADIGQAAADKSSTLAEAKRRSARIHAALRYIDRTVVGVRTAIATAWHLHMAPHQHDATFDRPRIVRHDRLDARLDSMGFRNGIVDLPSGTLLDPVAGADRLVTRTTGVRFDPDKADTAATLFAHLDDQLRAFWSDVLAWSLRGRPSRRIWLVVGHRNSGKTTIAAAVQAALGDDYAGALMQDALQKQRGDSAHKGIAAFAAPRRIVTVEEPSTGQLDTSLLKLLSGGGRVTVRRLYKDPITVDATGSLIIFANPGRAVPRLGLADPALADRVRELPFPPVPADQRDGSFIADTIHTRDFREALAAYLVLAGADLTGPPASPQAVKDATQRRLELDLSPIEDFARRIRPGRPDDFLSSGTVWTKWMDFNEVDSTPDDGKVAKYTARSLAMALPKHVPDLPKTSRPSIGGKRERGWAGWRYEQ